MLEAAYGVGPLHVLAGVAEVRVLDEVILLRVELVQVQQVLGHGGAGPGVRVGLQAQAAQQQVLDGLGQCGLQRRRRWVDVGLAGILLPLATQ